MSEAPSCLAVYMALSNAWVPVESVFHFFQGGCDYCVPHRGIDAGRERLSRVPRNVITAFCQGSAKARYPMAKDCQGELKRLGAVPLEYPTRIEEYVPYQYAYKIHLTSHLCRELHYLSLARLTFSQLRLRKRLRMLSLHHQIID